MASTFDELYALNVPEIQAIFLEIMQSVVDQAMLNEMIKAIEAGDAEALYRATGFTSAVLNPLLDRIEAVYRESAEFTVDGWPARIKTPTGPVLFNFNVRNPVVEQDLKSYSSERITEIVEETKDVVRESLREGMSKGNNPRTTALNLIGRINPSTGKRTGGTLGLTSKQQLWVQALERRLTTLDKTYFQMGLRDKRFDKTVLKAIETQKPLDQDTVNKIVSSYKNKALKFRAEMVARTETTASIERGHRAAHLQGIEEGTLKKEAITKEWDDIGDLRTRPSHRIMGLKYGKNKGVGFDEPFVFPSGVRMQHPCDQSLGAPAKEIVHCRCSARYRVDWKKNAG